MVAVCAALVGAASLAGIRSGICGRGKKRTGRSLRTRVRILPVGQRFLPCVVVVEEGMDDPVAREERNSLVQIHHRVEHDAVNRR